MKSFVKEMVKTLLYRTAYAWDVPVARPDTLQISLTSRCNLRCRMCSVNKYATKAEEEMPLDEVRRVIDAARRDFGIRKLVITGGEPLLLGQMIADATAHARAGGMDVILTTNGFFLKEQAAALATAGVTHFHVSLDGLKGTHNYLRNHPDSFDKAVEGIRTLADLRRRGQGSFSIGIGIVVVKQNIPDLLDMYRWADTLGVNVFDLLPYLPDNTDFSDTRETSLWPDEEDVRRFLEMYRRMAEIPTRHIRVNRFLDVRLLAKYYRRTLQKKDWQCMAGYKNIFITMSDPMKRGRFEPCLFLCKGQLPIRDSRYDLKKVWRSREAGALRRSIKRCDAYCYQICFSLPSLMNYFRTT